VHHDYLVSLRTQIAHTGRKMTDETFFDSFMASLLKSVDVFVFVYEDKTYNVDLFREKYTRLELQQRTCDLRSRKSDSASIAMYGHSASSLPRRNAS